MDELLVGGLLALAGVVVKAVIDLVADGRSGSRARAARQFDVEYESLHELSDMLPRFIGPQPADLEARKVHAVALAQRVRDPRATKAVELLMVQPVGSQAWNDQVGNAVRDVGAAMRDL